jgi:hypothetical protein
MEAVRSDTVELLEIKPLMAPFGEILLSHSLTMNHKIIEMLTQDFHLNQSLLRQLVLFEFTS